MPRWQVCTGCGAALPKPIVGWWARCPKCDALIIEEHPGGLFDPSRKEKP